MDRLCNGTVPDSFDDAMELYGFATKRLKIFDTISRIGPETVIIDMLKNARTAIFKAHVKMRMDFALRSFDEGSAMTALPGKRGGPCGDNRLNVTSHSSHGTAELGTAGMRRNIMDQGVFFLERGARPKRRWPCQLSLGRDSLPGGRNRYA